MIWIIGGTKDSRDITEKILNLKNEKLLISTATEYGGKLFKNMDNSLIEIIDQKLDISEMEKIITEKKISVIIDASHPYAVNVSSNVMTASKKTGVKYFRFERCSSIMKPKDLALWMSWFLTLKIILKIKIY